MSVKYAPSLTNTAFLKVRIVSYVSKEQYSKNKEREGLHTIDPWLKHADSIQLHLPDRDDEC